MLFCIVKAMAKTKGIVLEGLKELIDHVHALPEAIGAKSKDAFNEFAGNVMSQAKQVTPYDPERKSGTHLKDTGFIRKAASNTKPTVYLGFSAPHAHLVHNDIAGKRKASHYSTPGTGPKFLERPFQQKRAALEAAIDAILGEAIK